MAAFIGFVLADGRAASIPLWLD